MKCSYHLCDNELTGKQRKFCSRNCNSKAGVLAWRERTKHRAIDYLGGSCERCGYKRCKDALEFHHRDSTEKSFSVSKAMVHIRSWEAIRAELDKCDLLCANCHRELHAAEQIELRR